MMTIPLNDNWTKMLSLKWKFGYLPGSGVVAEVAERVLEPSVDLVERQLSLRWLDNCLYQLKKEIQLIPIYNGGERIHVTYLTDEWGVSERWADIGISIELAITLQFYWIIRNRW